MRHRDDIDRLWDSIQDRIASGKLTEDSPVSAVSLDSVFGFDSLDMVELVMAVEEGDFVIGEIATVGDLLRLLKTVRFQRDHKARR